MPTPKSFANCFVVRDYDPRLWRRFKARAKTEGHTLRWIIMRLIERYVDNGIV